MLRKFWLWVHKKLGKNWVFPKRLVEFRKKLSSREKTEFLFHWVLPQTHKQKACLYVLCGGGLAVMIFTSFMFNLNSFQIRKAKSRNLFLLTTKETKVWLGTSYYLCDCHAKFRHPRSNIMLHVKTIHLCWSPWNWPTNEYDLQTNSHGFCDKSIKNGLLLRACFAR